MKQKEVEILVNTIQSLADPPEQELPPPPPAPYIVIPKPYVTLNGEEPKELQSIAHSKVFWVIAAGVSFFSGLIAYTIFFIH